MSERLRSVVERLGLRPDDRVLEIGCGHGVAATLVCERLEEGHARILRRQRGGVRRRLTVDQLRKEENRVPRLRAP